MQGSFGVQRRDRGSKRKCLIGFIRHFSTLLFAGKLSANFKAV
jgi:hypothetical protein